MPKSRRVATTAADAALPRHQSPPVMARPTLVVSSGQRSAMTVAELIENIKKLPPEEQRDIEAIVRTRVERRSSGQLTTPPRYPQDLLERIAARREQLGRDFGPFDSAQAIMEFREGRI